MAFRLLELPTELLDHTLSLLDTFEDRLQIYRTCKKLQSLTERYLYRNIPIRPNAYSLPAFVKLACHKPTILQDVEQLEVGDWHAGRRCDRGYPPRNIFPGLQLSNDWEPKAASLFSSMLSSAGNHGNDEGRNVRDVLGDCNVVPNEALVALLLKHTHLQTFTHYVQERGEPQWLQLFQAAMVEPDTAPHFFKLKTVRLVSHRPQLHPPRLSLHYLQTCLMLPSLQELQCDDACRTREDTVSWFVNMTKYSHEAFRVQKKRPPNVRRLILKYCRLTESLLAEFLILSGSGLEHLTIHQAVPDSWQPLMFDIRGYSEAIRGRCPNLHSLAMSVDDGIDYGPTMRGRILVNLSQMSRLTHVRINQEALFCDIIRKDWLDDPRHEDAQAAMVGRLTMLPANLQTLEISVDVRRPILTVMFTNLALTYDAVRPRNLHMICLWSFDTMEEGDAQTVFHGLLPLAKTIGITFIAHNADCWPTDA